MTIRTRAVLLLGSVTLMLACGASKKPAPAAVPDDTGRRARTEHAATAPPGYQPAAGDETIKNSEVAYNLALEYAGKGELQAAHHYIDLAMVLQPDSKYSFTKGLLLIGEKKFSEAMGWLERSLQQGPGTADNRLAVLNALGATYMQLGQDEKALAEFREVVNSPGMISRYESYYNMGVIYYRQQKYLDAQAVFEKVVDENPGYYRAYNKLGLLAGRKGDWGQAALLFKRAIDLVQNNYPALQAEGAEMYLNYGEALFNEKLYPESRQALMTVLRVAPESEAGARAKEFLAKIGTP